MSQDPNAPQPAPAKEAAPQDDKKPVFKDFASI